MQVKKTGVKAYEPITITLDTYEDYLQMVLGLADIRSLQDLKAAHIIRERLIEVYRG